MQASLASRDSGPNLVEILVSFRFQNIRPEDDSIFLRNYQLHPSQRKNGGKAYISGQFISISVTVTGSRTSLR